MSHRSPTTLTVVDRMFGIDVRSLAAFRIVLGALLLLDLFFRAQYMTAFYSDLGFLPRIARISFFEDYDPSGLRQLWSLHMLSGENWAQWILFGVAAWFAFSLAIGYRTRLATFASWLLLVSLDNRNPMIIDSGDVLFRSLLFWSIFLPLGGTWSIDAARHPTVLPAPRQVVSIATLAIIVQTCTMYWFSIVFKWSESWLNGSAVYYALSNDIFVTPLGRFLVQFPSLTKSMTYATLGLELFGPMLVFVPWGYSRLRLLVVALFTLLHLGFVLCLSIGLFAFICAAAWIPMLPGSFWDRLETWLARRAQLGHRPPWSSGCARMGDWICQRLPRPETPRFELPVISKLFVALMLVYVLAWNLRETDLEYWESRIMPRRFSIVGRVLGLDQRWSMFAPIPSTEDGWYVFKGTLRNGDEVNLLNPGAPLPWEKPRDVSATFISQRWRKYLDALKHDEYAVTRPDYINFLVRQWNHKQAAHDTNREVKLVEYYLMFEETPKPDAGQFPPQPILLWRWEYE